MAKPLEQRLLALWEEVLGRSDIGVQDNFFAVGGHSIKLIALRQRMVASGFDISITDLFRLGTVEACAAHLRAVQGDRTLEVTRASNGSAAIAHAVRQRSALERMRRHAAGAEGDHRHDR